MPVRIEHAVDSAAVATAGKRLYVKSYGCQMNVYDGLRMVDLLSPLGYTLQDDYTGADLIILNTCHIREKADDKVFSDIGRMKKEAAAGAIIAVGGCTGQAMGADIMRQSPAVSIVFGPQTYHRLPDYIAKVEHGRATLGKFNVPIRVTDTDFPELEKFDKLPPAGLYGPSAFLTIQEGCDKFCTYCVVPYTRGAEISRPAADIVAEAESLAAQGAKELYLLGQNVNAYHGDDGHGGTVSLAKLFEELGKIEGIERLRFTTSHPMNTTDDLIDCFVSNPKVMPFFHLPVQAGSNRILRAMNRSHTVESYLETLAKVRQVRPDIALSGDFIVGFPGETEEDYQQTLAIAHAAGYVYAYSFIYSPRPGTPAAELPDQVPEDVKKERLAGLQAVLDDNQARFNQQFLHTTQPVLAEGLNEKGQLFGRSPHNISVNFSMAGATTQHIGQTFNVHITEARQKSLLGKVG
ncbi:MAG: tRNA (N6-isopentenyl adenosine(37)-C2)-methylthiotransferase MiaB [Alphaproteobacteria bacterium]